MLLHCDAENIPEKAKVNDAPATCATRVPLVQEPAPLSWAVSTQDVKVSYLIRESKGSTRAVLIVSPLEEVRDTEAEDSL